MQAPQPAKKSKFAPKAADLQLGQSPAALRMVRQPLARPTAPALAEFHGPCLRWACIAVAVHKFPSPVGKFKWVPGCTFRPWTRPSDPAADRGRVPLGSARLRLVFGPEPGHLSSCSMSIVQLYLEQILCVRLGTPSARMRRLTFSTSKSRCARTPPVRANAIYRCVS